jgi:hypothetical protein
MRESTKHSKTPAITVHVACPSYRLLALVGRNVGDFLWAFVAPEVLGAVNDESLTHGYVVARWGSVNQFFMPPEDVMRHTRSTTCWAAASTATCPDATRRSSG